MTMATRKENYNVTVKKQGQVWQVNIVHHPVTQSTELFSEVQIKDEPDCNSNLDCTIGSSAETDILFDAATQSANSDTVHGVEPGKVKEEVKNEEHNESMGWQVNVAHQLATQSNQFFRDVEMRDEPACELDLDCTFGSSAETGSLFDAASNDKHHGAEPEIMAERMTEEYDNTSKKDSSRDKKHSRGTNKKKKKKAGVNKKLLTDKVKSLEKLKDTPRTDDSDFALMKPRSRVSHGTVYHPKQMQYLFGCIFCEAQFLATVSAEAEVAQNWEERPPWIECSSCKQIRHCTVIQRFTGRSGSKEYRHLPRPNVVCQAGECQHKNVVYKTTAAYFEHCSAMHDNEPKTCEQCGVSCKNLFRYKKHVANMHKKEEALCMVCGRTFLNAAKMKRHVVAVHNPNPPPKRRCINCGICNKKMASSWSLTKHMTTHQEKETRPRHTCQICDKSFLSEAGFKVHTLAHTQKYQCRHCNKCLSTKAGIAYHERKTCNTRSCP